MSEQRFPIYRMWRRLTDIRQFAVLPSFPLEHSTVTSVLILVNGGGQRLFQAVWCVEVRLFQAVWCVEVRLFGINGLGWLERFMTQLSLIYTLLVSGTLNNQETATTATITGNATTTLWVCFVGCLSASVPQGRICSDNFT